tara:strand:+ start:699 stop:1250 length:552 start_codon:yes stop_codon:yes gene_type:complete
MKTFIVLGMHRSGTSLLAKALHTFDNDPKVSMGDIMLEDSLGEEELKLANGSNSQGHFEDDEFMQLNERILAAAEGSWFKPPTREKILSVSGQFSEEIKALVNKRSAPIWGWKDPRSCLTIDLFHPYIENPHYICMFRSVEGVAESLVRRDEHTIGMYKEYAMNLAREYNRRILQFMSEVGVT